MLLKRDVSRGSSSLSHTNDTVTFFLLGFLIAFYMLAGAAVFSALERSAELQAHRLWKKRLRDFSQDFNISSEYLKSLLHHYEEARTAGIRTEPGRALWDIPGAFYFVGTVVSTIGFGVSAPSTTPGKVLIVIYGLFGCPATILFFNLFLERVISVLSLFTAWRHHSRSMGSEGKESYGVSKPSVYYIAIALFLAVLVVSCVFGLIYSVMEGWSYLESLYFCFVAFSTVGFGDLVSSQREQHENILVYQVANCLMMLFGVCCTNSLFNIISVIIRQGLNGLMGTFIWVYYHVSGCKEHLRLFNLWFSGSEPGRSRKDESTSHQHVQVVSS
ncbi:potassium channel subfamily K member 13 [Neosynchiropus ocellatus]